MKYDVALSFAGEDREYVEEVATELKQQGVRVFYDKFETINLWGKDLYAHLQNVYQNQAKFTIIFISKHYAKKNWTNHERKMTQARAFEESREYILPVRFDDTEIEGITGTTGYIDLRKISPKEFCSLICEKIEFEPSEQIEKIEIDPESQIKELIQDTIPSSTRAEDSLEEKTQSIKSRIDMIRRFHHFQSLSGFLFELDPLTKQNIVEIVDNLGIDFVISARGEELNKKFSIFYQIMTENGFYPNTTVNGGAMTGLRGHGILDTNNNLTPFGISTFKTIANTLKS